MPTLEKSADFFIKTGPIEAVVLHSIGPLHFTLLFLSTTVIRRSAFYAGQRMNCLAHRNRTA